MNEAKQNPFFFFGITLKGVITKFKCIKKIRSSIINKGKMLLIMHFKCQLENTFKAQSI